MQERQAGNQDMREWQFQPFDVVTEENILHSQPTVDPKKPEMISSGEEEAARGTEVIIYESPKELPKSSSFFFMFYLFMQYTGDVVKQLGGGALIIYAYQQPFIDFIPLFYFLLSFHVFKVIWNVIYYLAYGKRMPELKSVYIMDILLDIGLVCSYTGVVNFLEKKITADELKYYVVPYIVLTFARMVIGTIVSTPYIPGRVFYFFESFQFLAIAIRIANPQSDVSWSWTLIFYYVMAGFALAGGAIILFMMFVFLCMYVGGNHQMVNTRPAVVVSAIGTGIYIVWNCICYFLLIHGFRKLLETNHIYELTPELHPSRLLLTTSWIMGIASLVTLICMIIIFVIMKRILLEYFIANKTKEVSLQSFAKNLHMNITQISGNYFRPTTPNGQGSKPEGNLETCVVCSDKQIDSIIHPCGHGCFCESCAREYLKEKDGCPMCRERIEKVYLIVQDPEKKDILARGVIKLKR